MDCPDDVWASQVQDFVAALELLEVLQRQIPALQHRAHGAIRDHDTLGECGSEISRPRRAEVSRRLSGTQAIGHLVRIVAVDTLWSALTTMWSKHLSLNRRLQ